MNAFGVAAILGLTGAAICLLILVEPDWAAMRSEFTRSAARRLGVERVREDLAQTGLRWLPVTTWLSLRVAASVMVGVIAYAAFGVLVLGLVGCLACYHLIGLVLEQQRRRRQLVLEVGRPRWQRHAAQASRRDHQLAHSSAALFVMTA